MYGYIHKVCIEWLLDIGHFQVTGYSGQVLNRLYASFRQEYPTGYMYRRWPTLGHAKWCEPVNLIHLATV